MTIGDRNSDYTFGVHESTLHGPKCESEKAWNIRMLAGFCGSQLAVGCLAGDQRINHSTVREYLKKLRSRKPLPHCSVAAAGFVANSLVDKTVVPAAGCF